MSFVYVIEATPGLVKIGISDDPKRRMRGVQTGCPYLLTLKAQVKVRDPRFVERYVHEHFHAERLQGEWFAVACDVAVAAVNEAAGIISVEELTHLPDRYFKIRCCRCGRVGVAFVPGRLEQPRFRCSKCGSDYVTTTTTKPAKKRKPYDCDWRPAS